MEPSEIFDLIVKADERLKYAASGKTDARVQQARDMLTRALEAAREIGNEPLVRQAQTRLADIDELSGETG